MSDCAIITSDIMDAYLKSMDMYYLFKERCVVDSVVAF